MGFENLQSSVEDLSNNTIGNFTMPECTSMSSPIGNLPDEILIQIIDCVRCSINREREDIFFQRWKDLIKVTAFGQTPRYVYAPWEPILDSIQSLGAVNQRFYRICRPMLWKHLQLPNELPTPMRRWTHELLPKHGTLIQSLWMELSDDWYEPFYESFFNFAEPEELHQRTTVNQLPMNIRDNVVISSFSEHDVRRQPDLDPPQHISPESAQAVITQCPNLRLVNLSFPKNLNSFDERYQSDDPDDTDVSVEPEEPSVLRHYHLCNLLLSMRRLQHLQLEFRMEDTISEEGLEQIMEKLPRSLKSLSWTWGAISVGNFGFNGFAKGLAELKDLECLILKRVDSLDNSWTDSTPVSSLTKLKLDACKNFNVDVAPRAISTFAPNLTHLDIYFIIPEDDEQESEANNVHVNLSADGNHYFDLPALTHLTTYHGGEFNLPRSFRKCHNLRHFSYYHLQDEEWSSFSDLVCASTWPRLEFLYLPGAYTCDQITGANPDISGPKHRLHFFCQQNSIQLSNESDDFTSFFKIQR